ncbi:MAG: HK97 family phage prohead protease [Xanthomonadaceae bacterium]|nr:HK97 family phage prohead protease [Xanthomonadaceae bacterium]
MAKGIALISATGAPICKRLDLNLSGVTKFVSAGQRRLRGYASTDDLDRQGDVVVPSGGQWTLPVALLWQHKHDMPIGWVRAIEVRGSGLWIEAEVAQGMGQADEAWRMVEADLVTGYSLGFRPIKGEPLKGRGLRYTQWELLEVSVVTVPANPGAKIQRGMGAIPLIQVEY